MTAVVAVATTRDGVLDAAVEHVAHQGRTVTLRQRGMFTWSVEVDGPLPPPLTPSDRLVQKNRRLRRLLREFQEASGISLKGYRWPSQADARAVGAAVKLALAGEHEVEGLERRLQRVREDAGRIASDAAAKLADADAARSQGALL